MTVGATMNVTLPQSYIEKNNQIAARQLVLASHRLAKVIEQIFGSNTSTENIVSIHQEEIEYIPEDTEEENFTFLQ